MVVGNYVSLNANTVFGTLFAYCNTLDKKDLSSYHRSRKRLLLHKKHLQYKEKMISLVFNTCISEQKNCNSDMHKPKIISIFILIIELLI